MASLGSRYAQVNRVVAGWWNRVGAKKAGDNPEAAGLPLIEQLEPRLLLSADSVGLEPLVATNVPFDGAAAYADPDQDDGMVEDHSSAILTYLASPEPADEPQSYMLTDHWGGSEWDADKDDKEDTDDTAPGTGDDYMCWAAAASNMLAWTGWGNVSAVNGTADDIFGYYQDHWTDEGGGPQYAFEWWFDGDNDKQGASGWADVEADGGDFYPGVDHDLYISFNDHEDGGRYKDALPDIASYFEDANAVAVSLSYGRGGHCLTCWGYDYNLGDPDYYVGIWLTDSDDGSEGLHRYGIDLESGVWEITDGDYSGRHITYVDALQKKPESILEVPPSPQNVVASQNIADRIVVTWDAASRAASYRVYRNTTDDFASSSLLNANVLSMQYDDTSVAAGVTYYYWVKASNTGGTSKESSPATGSGPYLQPTAVDSSVWQSAEPGILVDWTVTVKNNGSGWQRADWRVQWYLSSDNKYQPNDTLIGSATWPDDIAPGANVVVKPYNAEVPSVATAGQKYLIARVVNAGPETKTSNNTKAASDRDWFGPVDLDGNEPNNTQETATDLGYIAGTWTQNGKTLDVVGDVDWYKFTILGTAGKSQKVRINFAHAEGDLALGLYRSDGSPIQEADKAGNSESVSLSGLAEGTYYIKVWGNHGDVSRNYKLTLVSPAGPDLRPTAVDSGVWQSAKPGADVAWTVTVKNGGKGPQWADWTVEWYLSSDKKYQNTDLLVGSETYSDGIAKGASVTKTYNAPVPEVATAGHMYVIARVVNAGPDARASNNTHASKDKDWFGQLGPDADEPNNTLGAAFDLGSFTGKRARQNLTIDSAQDVDWYKFTMTKAGTSKSKVQIDFTNAEGDLALVLCGSDGTPIQQVDKTGKTETIKLKGLAAGTYYLKVLSAHGDVSRNYRLTLIL
jgi:hypothetical protein